MAYERMYQSHVYIRIYVCIKTHDSESKGQEEACKLYAMNEFVVYM